MTRSSYDIAVVGGGLAGMTAALALGATGARVCLIGRQPPVVEASAAGSDLRSTAFLQPAVQLLKDAGVWDTLTPRATPLEGLRIVDSTGEPPTLRDQREFRATDLGEDAFGWNLLNVEVAAALSEVLKKSPHVDVRPESALVDMLQRDQAVLCRMSDGERISARLVVGADGRDSTVRDLTGIPVEQQRYGQKALAFVTTHPIPHGNVSTEIYHEGGPFTMVPLPSVDGVPASAIVWMNPGRKALDIATLPEAEFNATASERSLHWLGPLRRVGPIRTWPVITQRAKALTSRRVALIAEAAHVVPPIGAQGLNTSLNDVIALRDALQKHPHDPGDGRVLQDYSRARATDIAARVAAIDLFNQVTRSGNARVQALRLGGLKAVFDIKPVRQTIMRAGMAT